MFALVEAVLPFIPINAHVYIHTVSRTLVAGNFMRPVDSCRPLSAGAPGLLVLETGDTTNAGCPIHRAHSARWVGQHSRSFFHRPAENRSQQLVTLVQCPFVRNFSQIVCIELTPFVKHS